MKPLNRNQSIDILRGIGIISVVLGHALNTDIFFTEPIEYLRRFVYTYHLAIFFFCSGYCWKEKDPKTFFMDIFKKQYLKTTVACLASLLLFPLFCSLGAIDSQIELLPKVISTLRYAPSGILTGAMWFMRFFTVAAVLYYIISFIPYPKLRGGVLLTIGIVGCVCVNYNLLHYYRINDAMLMQPIMYCGELLKKRTYNGSQNSSKYQIKPAWICLISCVLIAVINYISGLQIELSKNMVYGLVGFYPMTILGIIFVISLGHILGKMKYFGAFIAFLGKNSFWIMLTHFQVFKLIDGLECLFWNAQGNAQLFPISFGDIGHRLIYFILGLLVPALSIIFIRWIYRKTRILLKKDK